uniref:Uncharacterized protein n=1 Tax=Plectus sambesii TaxID=2011161 RepID=A0A914W1X8_9BILA
MAKTVKTQERNQIGFFGATSYVIGNIIGSGIFITPTSILKETNSVGLSMAVWAVSGAISLIGSLCYIELGTSIRHSGGDFAYICYVKWYPIAFAFMWVSILLTYPATIAVQAETFGEYILTGIDPLLCVDQAYRNIVQKLLGFSLLYEKIFNIEQAHNHQNDRQLLPKGTSPDVVTRSHFPKSVMVWAGITATGKTPLVFVDRKVKINAAIYQQLILRNALDPWAKKHFGNRPWTLQQDWAPAHLAKTSIFLCKSLFPDVWDRDVWPPNSPDPNPLDYSVWSIL